VGVYLDVDDDEQISCVHIQVDAFGARLCACALGSSRVLRPVSSAMLAADRVDTGTMASLPFPSYRSSSTHTVVCE